MADYATLVFDIDSTQARGAAKALGDLNSAAIKAANGSARFEKTLRDVNGRFQSTDKYLTAHRAEIEGLAMAYNPVLAAQIRYRDEVVKTAAAVKAGVITEQQRVDILQRTKAALDATAGAAQRFGAAQQQSGHHTANVFSQLNDIGVMMAAGQNPIQLALQQGTQLNQVWASMGKEGKTLSGVVGTLGGAIRSMISPMSLLTLGVIAGGAALVQWLSSADGVSGSSKNATEAVDKLSDAVSAYVTSSNAARASNESLRQTYGALSREAAIALENIASIDRRKALDAIAESTKVIFDNASVSLRNVSPYLQGFTDQVDRLDYAFKLSGQSAENVLKSINRLSASKGPSQTAEAAQALSDELMKAYGSYEKMPEKAREVYAATQNITVEAGKIVGQTDNWASSMASVLSYTNAVARSLANIGGGAIGRASASAEIAALQQGKTLAEASVAASRERARLESVEVVKGLKIQNKYLRAGAEFAANAIAQGDVSREARLDALREEARIREREAKKKPKSDGSAKAAERQAAAELKSAEKGFQSLRELLDKQSAYQVVEYEKRLGQLNAALGKQLIAEKSYQEMKAQLQLTYFGSEYEKNAVNYQLDLEQLNQLHAAKLLSEEQYQMARKQLQHDYYSNAISVNQNQSAQQLSNMAADFAQMNQLAGGGYDKLLRAQKAFAAGSALINAYLAATQALADPTVGFWGKFAAYAKVFAAGIGAVNAIKGAGSGGGGGGGSSSAGSVKQEPTKNVLIRLEGDDWLTGLAEQMMTQIYEASSNGRVIVSRDNS